MRRAAFILVTLAWIAGFVLTDAGVVHAAESQPVLTLDLSVQRQVEGIGDIPCASGIVVNGQSRMAHVEETRALNCAGARLYLTAFPKLTLGKERDTEKGVELLLSKNFQKEVPEAFESTLFPGAKRSAAGGINEQYWQLEQLQAWNLRENIVLHINAPSPRTPDDFAQYAQLYLSTLREVRRRYPDLKPLYMMTYNEPDYAYPRKWETRSLDESVKLFMDLHKYLRDAIAKEFPDVTLVGPGISHFPDWHAWQHWTKAFVRQVPGDNLFNCQPYVRDQNDLVAWASMLKAESLRVNGKILPLFMTETNSDLQPSQKEWWLPAANIERVNNEAKALFLCMQRPDLFSHKYYFYYHYDGTCFDMWQKLPDGTFKPSPVYWLYYLLRDVRGRRVFAEFDREDAGDLMTIASLNNQDLCLALYNSSERERTVKLDMRRPDGAADCSVIIESYAYSGEEFVYETKGYLSAPETLTFVPGEVKKLRWTLSPTAPLLTRQCNEHEYPAAETGVSITPESPRQYQIKLPKNSATGTRTVLRAGLYFDDLYSSPEAYFYVNGTRFAVASRPDAYTKQKKYPVEMVEIWLPDNLVKTENSILFEAQENSSYKVMFLSLAQLALPEDAPRSVASLAHRADPAPASISMSLPKLITPGTTEAQLLVKNNTEAVQSISLRLQLPNRWRMQSPVPDIVELQPSEAREFHVGLQSPDGLWRGMVHFAASAAVSGKPVQTVKRGAFFNIPLQAEYVEQPPMLDGTLEEWNKDSFVTVHHSGPTIAKPYDTEIASKWDKDYLYVALRCEGRALNPVPAGCQVPWSYDVFELFLDFFQKRRNYRDNQCVQNFAPVQYGKDTIEFYNVPTDPNGCFMKQELVSGASGFCKSTGANSFVIELMYPWDKLVESPWTPANECFKPAAGASLGCEFGLASRSLIGGVIKEYASPYKWGTLRLLAPGKKTATPCATIIPENAELDARADTRQPASFSLDLLPAYTTAGWTLPKGSIQNGLLRLSNRQKNLILANDELPSFLTNDGLTLSMGILDFQQDTSAIAANEEKTIHLRSFLTPDLPDGYIDPYTMRDCMCLCVSPEPATNTAAGAKVSLFLKENAGEGWGRNLCNAIVEKLPAKISLHLDAKGFKISSDQNIVVQSGAISGKMPLDPRVWETKLRYGLRCVYGQPAFASISSISLQTE